MFLAERQLIGPVRAAAEEKGAVRARYRQYSDYATICGRNSTGCGSIVMPRTSRANKVGSQ